MASQFDASADAYEASAGMPVWMWMEEPSIRAVCGDVKGASVIDMGCGTGTYTRRLARWGASHTLGVDESEGMLARARELEADNPLGVAYGVQDLARSEHIEPPLKSVLGKIDLALAVYVLCYAETEDELTQMCRLARMSLRPGGRFVAATMDPDYADEAELPGWYAGYQFSVAARSWPVSEGSKVRLKVSSTPPIAVDAVWWSRETYERVLRQTGFAEISWHAYHVSEEGIARQGEHFWANYTGRPHAVIIEAW
jgi:SAM-dependent methyltransferase